MSGTAIIGEMDSIDKYVSELNRQIDTGKAGEESYRAALSNLLKALEPGIEVTNEPTPEAYGIPDMLITRRGLQVAYVETKRLDDHDLDGRGRNKSQFDRYKESLGSIVFTNYLSFHLYEQGELAEVVDLAELRGGKAVPCRGDRGRFAALVSRLTQARPLPITNAARLAFAMAKKARLIAEVIRRIFEVDADSRKDSDRQLFMQYEAFRHVLISDLSADDFAGIYAQTIVYGMFTAKLNDASSERFSRAQAASLIPMTNPFLRNVFDEVAGLRMDRRIAWIVDDLIEVFNATDIARVMEEYTVGGRHCDPMIHFYEQFLSAYDPSERTGRGVFYTPQPVVGFIVRSVDEVLKTCFGLADGLADCSRAQGHHRVQILDPATGTGTFLAEVVNAIHDRFRGLQGAWQSYVAEHLIDRLNGFEILMASYAIAHLKLDMVLRQTGYRHRPDDGRRLHIFLTNSLEKREAQAPELFFYALAREAEMANHIKEDVPVMVMIGNPPYSGESHNGELGETLVEKYKVDPATGRNIADTKWLNGDEVKFIALAQDYVERNGGGGVVGYINPHTYLHAMTFRGMRWELLRTFDRIYILNLHGNAITGETKGSDENVFDVKQGVCVNLFVRNGSKPKGALAEVYYASLYGMGRTEKYRFLDSHTLSTVGFQRLHPEAPFYFLEPKDFTHKKTYDEGFGIDELFLLRGMGMRSCRDQIAYQSSREELVKVLEDFRDMPELAIKEKYHIEKETSEQKTSYAKNCIRAFGISDPYIKRVNFRPFDKRWTYFTDMSRGFVARPVYKVMRNLADGGNVALVVSKQCSSAWRYAFVTDVISDTNLIASSMKLGGGYTFPLYAYTTDIVGGKQVSKRRPNLNEELERKIGERLGESIRPQELFDYIYAVLYCPAYRSMYGEMLKTGFPRIPYPTDKRSYHALARMGERLRHLHLMDGEADMSNDVTFLGEVEGEGQMRVTGVSYGGGKVHINAGQCFGNVPQEAWDAHVGGYQPAQKWLKDRIGCVLSFDDILHYKRMIAVLSKTHGIMGEIDGMLLTAPAP